MDMILELRVQGTQMHLLADCMTGGIFYQTRSLIHLHYGLRPTPMKEDLPARCALCIAEETAYAPPFIRRLWK
jgi:hypothetical protein